MKNHPLSPSALDEVLSLLSRYFNSKVQIKSTFQLSEAGRRNMVLRIDIQNPQKSIILKQTLFDTRPNKSEEPNQLLGRFARDLAALEFLSTLKINVPSTPKFYGGSLKHKFILMEDLGENHISLVDSLTCSDATQAKHALVQFMTCLGQLHACSYGKTEDYFKILEKIDPSIDFRKDSSNKAYLIQEDLPDLKLLLEKLDLTLSEEALLEIHTVFDSMIEPGEFTTLVHGDICPDNVFDCPKKNELHLIDFEWSSIKNALLDGSYLRMNFPTCWCAKALPSELIGSLESTYREQLIKTIPAAKNDEKYHRAYLHAAAFWMLKSILFLEQALEKEVIGPSGPVPEKSLWKPGENKVRPRALSRLLSFIEIAKKHKQLPHLFSLAEKVLKELKLRWPEAKPLDLYPAFKNDN